MSHVRALAFGVIVLVSTTSVQAQLPIGGVVGGFNRAGATVNPGAGFNQFGGGFNQFGGGFNQLGGGGFNQFGGGFNQFGGGFNQFGGGGFNQFGAINANPNIQPGGAFMANALAFSAQPRTTNTTPALMQAIQTTTFRGGPAAVRRRRR